MEQLEAKELCHLATSRIYEVRLVRLKDFPAVPAFRYRTTAGLTTEAKAGLVEIRPNVAVINARLKIEARFSEEVGSPPTEGATYCELHLTIEGAFETDIEPSTLSPKAQIGTRTMQRVGIILLGVGEVYARQILSMAQLPFTLELDKLLSVAQNPVPVSTPG